MENAKAEAIVKARLAEQEKSREIAKNFLDSEAFKKGALTYQMIAEATGLTEEEVRKLK